MTYKGINFNGSHATIGTKLECWCNFIMGEYWLADRMLVLCKVTNPTSSEGLYASAPTVSGLELIKYELDENNYCIIDGTDFYRTYRGAHEFLLWYGSTYEQSVYTLFDDDPKGLINPAGVYIPKYDGILSGALILPPSKMLFANGLSSSVAFEFYKNQQGTYTRAEYDAAGDRIFIGTIAQGSYALHDTAVKLELTHLTEKITIQLVTPECDAETALVEWVSFTGVTRRHLFEVTKHKTETDDAYELLSLDNQTREIKGREDSFTIRLDGLCAYDVWYYADVITSSRVQVSLDGGATFARVQVTTKSVTLPNPDSTDGKVEITVKWKKYDAVDM